MDIGNSFVCPAEAKRLRPSPTSQPFVHHKSGGKDKERREKDFEINKRRDEILDRGIKGMYHPGEKVPTSVLAYLGMR